MGSSRPSVACFALSLYVSGLVLMVSGQDASLDSNVANAFVTAFSKGKDAWHLWAVTPSCTSSCHHPTQQNSTAILKLAITAYSSKCKRLQLAVLCLLPVCHFWLPYNSMPFMHCIIHTVLQHPSKSMNPS